MTNPEAKRPGRKLLFVSENAHQAVTRMQARLKMRLGYRVTQSETVKRAIDALDREMEDGPK